LVLADAQESPTGGVLAPAAPAAPQSDVQPTTAAGPRNAEEQSATAAKAKPEKPWFMWENKVFTTTFVFTPIWDWTAFSQDDASKAQVGEQAGGNEWRAERVNFAGQLKFKTPWRWQIGGNYNGTEDTNGDSIAFMDVRLDIPVPHLGWVKVGKQKVGVSQEWIMSGIDMVFMERTTTDLAFVPQRNTGVIVTNGFADQRGTWSLGAFNDWFTCDNSFEANGNQFTARLTYLPVYQEEGATLVMVAADAFYKEATNGTLQFRARPELNNADYFLDTGKFPGDHSLTTQLEAMAMKGSFMAYGNYSFTPVSAPSAGNPTFYGWFAGASYLLTGEHRNLNQEGGYYTKVVPSSPIGSDHGGFGAIEVGARYSYTDLTDRTVDGGRMSRWTGAVSWYPTKRWRIELNYGYSVLDRGGMRGGTHGFGTRLQWNLE
jgi:phosphate-selective porin